MSGVNKVILVGNLGKDPEVRHLENGVAVASFSLATTETYKDKTSGEKKSLTEWHNIVLWRGLAEIAEKYLKKGSQVYIEGKLRTRAWQDQEGNDRRTTEVVADNMTLLGTRQGSADPYRNIPVPDEGDLPPDKQYSAPSASSSAMSSSVNEPGNEELDDQLPF